ncbi:ribonuclease T2-like [Geranomyces michiganensis]|nr:ribonuclease T2-like [Geranomyces michiganensis]
MFFSRNALVAVGALAVSVSNARTVPFNPLAGGGTCSTDAVACKSGAPSDSCCLPDNGIIVFSQQWLTGYCAAEDCSAMPSVPNHWTIHGAWPNSCDSQQVSDCGQSDRTDIAGPLTSHSPELVQTMNKNWVSYKGDNNEFWLHEWSKHGTCWSPAAKSCFPDYKDGDDLAAYFGWVVALCKQFELGAALDAAKITTGGTYAKTDIIAAIQAAYPDLQVALLCKEGHLVEVYASVYATPSGGVAGSPVGTESTCPSDIKY